MAARDLESAVNRMTTGQMTPDKGTSVSNAGTGRPANYDVQAALDRYKTANGSASNQASQTATNVAQQAGYSGAGNQGVMNSTSSLNNYVNNASGSLSPSQSIATAAANAAKGSVSPASAGTYNIGSEKGYGIYNDLMSGKISSYTAADNSVWTRNPDGTVSIKHQGNTLTPNVTYRPPVNTGTVKLANGNTVQATVNYDPSGRIISVTLPNGGNITGDDVLTVNGVNYRYDRTNNQWYDETSQEYADLLSQRNNPFRSRVYDADEFTDYLAYLWDVEGPEAAMAAWDAIQSRYFDVENQLAAMNQAGTELGKLQLQQSYDNAIRDYQEQLQAAALQKAINQDNQALRMAAAGDMGGIGQKQYDTIMASYDQQVMNIQLEQLSLKQNVESQIAQLEAEGQYELAKSLAEIGQAQINALQEQYEYYNTLRFNTASALDQLSTERARNAISDAMNKLQLGIFTPEDAEALGVPAEEAQRVANRFKMLADIDLAAAQGELEKLGLQLEALRNGGVSGGGGRGSGNGGGGGGNPTTNPVLNPADLGGYTSDNGSRIIVKRANGTYAYAVPTANGYVLADGSDFSNGDKLVLNGTEWQYENGDLKQASPYSNVTNYMNFRPTWDELLSNSASGGITGPNGAVGDTAYPGLYNPIRP